MRKWKALPPHAPPCLIGFAHLLCLYGSRGRETFLLPALRKETFKSLLVHRNFRPAVRPRGEISRVRNGERADSLRAGGDQRFPIQNGPRKVLQDEGMAVRLRRRETFLLHVRLEKAFLGGKAEYTQKQVAARLGISRSYVSRIEKNAIEKLRLRFAAS